MKGKGCIICMRGSQASVLRARLDQKDAAEHPLLLRGIIFSPPSVSLQHCTLIHSERNTRLKTILRSETLTPRWDYRTEQAALCVAVLRLHTALIVWWNHKHFKYQNTSWVVELYPVSKCSVFSNPECGKCIMEFMLFGYYYFIFQATTCCVW